MEIEIEIIQLNAAHLIEHNYLNVQKTFSSKINIIFWLFIQKLWLGDINKLGDLKRKKTLFVKNLANICDD